MIKDKKEQARKKNEKRKAGITDKERKMEADVPGIKSRKRRQTQT